MSTDWYCVKRTMARKAKPRQPYQRPDDATVRQRILSAAFAAFMENGYAGTSTLEIATRAQVSKATLYSLVGDKQQMLAACVAERAERLRAPINLPEPRDRESLSRALAALGTQILREMSDPAVVGVFRLAIAEAVRSPAVARAVDSIGGEATRSALRGLMTRARAAGLLNGQPDKMGTQFFGLLWGRLMIGLLLRVAERPSPKEIGQRAADATDAFLRLYLA